MSRKSVAELGLSSDSLSQDDDARANLAACRFNLALDEAKIKRVADEATRAACRALAQDGAQVGPVADRLCTRYKVKPPASKAIRSVASRLTCSHWWRRNLRREHGMLFEAIARSRGFVNCRRGRYASDEMVRRRREQKARIRQLLSALVLTNELGEELTLAEIYERSESSPPVRRAALMVRMAGFECIANRHGYVGMFYTITCPSRMHAFIGETGRRNPKFDGTTAQKAQQYLCHQFAKARAKLNRMAVGIFGFRICEPHKDGTLHWHLLLFVRPDEKERLTEVLRYYALEVDAHEPGADRHRFVIEEIDPAKGSATGYVAKYISKHLDGKSLTADEFGERIDESIARVDAWASTWRIRQFQQIGGPIIGAWRELRRLRSPVNGGARIERARTAADNGDWASYIEAQGGPDVVRSAMPIRVWRVWNDKPGRYGEPKGYEIRGVVAGNLAIPTRRHVWKITLALTREPVGRDVSTRGPLASSVPSLWSWSPVNNCTERVRPDDFGTELDECSCIPRLTAGIPDLLAKGSYPGSGP